MNQIYNITHRLVAFILLFGLFLQSCGNSSNQPMPQEKEKDKKHMIGFLAPEITAYKRLNLNNFLPTIPKEEIKYIREIARGGMGVVYEATYQEATVAAKKLLNYSQEQVAAFQKEAVIMANHRHINIVSFLGFCPAEPALVMGYMSGGSLWGLLESSEKISWQDRYQIGLDVVEGMSYLHDLDIVHSDLKSRNILLDSRRRAKIADFGISALKNKNSTYGEWVGGTYQWMAPEIFYTDKNTKAGDVYSYGMLLWQMGSRKEPFESKKIFEFIDYIKAGNCEVVSKDTPPGIKKVIESCWLAEPPLKVETGTRDRPAMKTVRERLHKYYGKFCLELGITHEEALKTGINYLYGREGFSKNCKKAIRYFELSLEKGNIRAAYYLGNIHTVGYGLGADEKKGFYYYNLASEKGDLLSKLRLATYCYYGTIEKKDQIKALKLSKQVLSNLGGKEGIEQKIAQEDPNWLLEIGSLYRNGLGVTKNKRKAFDLTYKAAYQGDVRAQLILGMMYCNGNCAKEKPWEGIKWVRKAAVQGDVYAQYNLGNAYYNGRGIEQNREESAKWFQKAADQGFANAQYNLGNMYYNGEGVSTDKIKAVEWFQKSADQGHVCAQYNLANMYYNGEGVSTDKIKAVEWFQKSADQGHGAAQYNLACIRHNHG